MLQMYISVPYGKVVQKDNSIVFDNKVIQTDCTITANEPTNKITLRRAGIYLVKFNAIVSNTTSAIEFIGINMERDGVDVREAQTGASSSATNDLVPVSFSTLVKVKPSCCVVDNTTRLQFKVTGSDTLVYFANVIVSKLE